MKSSEVFKSAGPIGFVLIVGASLTWIIVHSPASVSRSMASTAAAEKTADKNFSGSIEKEKEESRKLIVQLQDLEKSRTQIATRLKEVSDSIQKKEALLSASPDLKADLSARTDLDVGHVLKVAESVRLFNVSAKADLARLDLKGKSPIIYLNADALFRQQENPSTLRSSSTRSLDAMVSEISKQQSVKSLVIYQDSKSRGQGLAKSRAKNLQDHFLSKFAGSLDSIEFRFTNEPKTNIGGVAPGLLVEMTLGSPTSL